jgi:hypothetical protein
MKYNTHTKRDIKLRGVESDGQIVFYQDNPIFLFNE